MTATTSEFAGRRVVVTGSSSGIGRALAETLVDLGAEVHGAARSGQGEHLASFTQLDLGDPESVRSAGASIGATGAVHALFNCAGATPMIDPLDILAVNFLGTRLFTEVLVPSMAPGSAVVNVSSDGGYGWRRKRELLLDFLAETTFEGGADWYGRHADEAGHTYAFSKEALVVWTMQQSAQLIGQGIRINTVSPGAVQTPMLEAIEAVFPAEMIDAVTHPIGRRSTPQEQVGPLLFLASDAASYINGIDVQVDGGFWAAQTVDGQFD